MFLRYLLRNPHHILGICFGVHNMFMGTCFVIHIKGLVFGFGVHNMFLDICFGVHDMLWGFGVQNIFWVFASESITFFFVIALGSRRCFGYLFWGPQHVLGIRFVVDSMFWDVRFWVQNMFCLLLWSPEYILGICFGVYNMGSVFAPEATSWFWVFALESIPYFPFLLLNLQHILWGSCFGIHSKLWVFGFSPQHVLGICFRVQITFW